ncbi:MAG: formylmethanofuran dehydrogenase subunit E [Desulforhopalus sp.]
MTIKDIIKWHGHDCEGITHVSNCCKTAFDILFPDGIIDRSVLKAISGTGPCWSDGIAFLTGARVQYGNLGFFKNKDYSHAVIIYREDTGVAVLATLKKGINNIPNEPVVLPGAITWKTKIDMQKIIDLKKVVKNSKGEPDPYQVDLMRYYQWVHVNDILSRPLSESYQAEIIKDFRWEDWVDTTKAVSNPHKRGDIRLKNYPYRDKPVSEGK